MYETPKSLGNIWKVKSNLMGAIVHGYGLYGFFDSFQWSHGAAYTISILVQVLLLLDNIPDTLYIQLDNCPGQKKNRYVLGFLAKLVEENIFKKVKLSFLMVGHTHEDIDQLFSRYDDLIYRGSNLRILLVTLLRSRLIWISSTAYIPYLFCHQQAV
ncbi:uncharacterized protein LOC128555383 [Mercenaria mercenaria]|uniref:uncharacterized protein LOC128555383 n=1 Tax=Mercenaria mercenaria TaxID=6596 RepID=UPI00234F17A1|nr:uncharacterized protein LOC128555383 [Mercenaria mercenaria]